ncbi:DNA-binding beta-propeller fold protein YncE [Thermosporothrix hazakensis]|uniref:DNA-binding beta-propeller fold protein YncE n=2 Tax=Thermosporothrix TaxID=768650 RepID=A0A326U369_THEHA|nr:hypothetical protein [Thermosporothrix hazakensis]PZW26363.1 DNA-binding beta-propeller fold protein YncE [Thermosporothrix hazakensis]BBH90634.1 hypothetical protein KTC_53850 [Thermosporothrix sp. COM3]GCE48685.1 hypothetical protein KTH_35540 [Thermosporothrix hazakensis]
MHRKRILSIVAVLALTALLLLPGSLPAFADGGAPNLAYVAGTARGISVIDVAQQRVTKTINMPGNPHTILLSKDASLLYVTQPEVDRISVIGAKEGKTICTTDIPGQPSHLVIDPSTGLIYTGGKGASGVREVDPKTCTVQRTFETNGPVYGMAIARTSSSLTHSANQLWISTDRELEIFDTSKGSQLGPVPIAGNPQYISIPPGSTAYVTTRAGSIVAVDISTHKVVQVIAGGKYGSMDYDETTGEIYVPEQEKNRLLVLAPVIPGFEMPREPNRVINIGVQPQSVAITSDGLLGFVALEGGNVAMLDVPGRTITNTIFVGGQPNFIITGLYPPLVGAPAQQEPIWGTLVSITSYVLIAALIIVPVLLFLRRRRMHYRLPDIEFTPSTVTKHQYTTPSETNASAEE